MRILKSIVRWVFAIQAAVFLLPAFAAVVIGIQSRLGAAHGNSIPAHRGGIAPLVYGCLVGVAIGLLYAAAWWTTRKAVLTHRGWAIAASVVTIAQGGLLLYGAHLLQGRTSVSPGDGLWFVGLGIGGVVLFGRKESDAAVSEPVVERKSVAGDRTSAVTRHAVTVLSCIAQLAAIVLWSRWAYRHDLMHTRGLVWMALVTVASVLTTIVHECGHALIAWCFDMSLLSFKAGPFQWSKREGRWKFKMHLAGLLTPGGAVGAVSKNPEQPRWEEILMIVAGPLANLLIGIPAAYAVLHDDWPHYQQTWELIAFTASFCLIAAILNLIPFMSEEGAYSDGARILQIVTQSPLEEYHRVMAAIASTATTERRYRDLDVTAIERAASLFAEEFRGLHLHLCACHCFEDRNRFPEASSALALAEGIYNNFNIDLPAPLHTVFVIGHAYLNRDAAAARIWWDRMEAKKNERQNVDYWLARTALLWIEGDGKGAEQAWFQADSLAQSLPKFGAYEFDRYRCFLLRQVLNETAVGAAIPPASVSLPPITPIAPSVPAAIPSVSPGQPRPHAASSKDEGASAPILPAWITPLPPPVIETISDAVNTAEVAAKPRLPPPTIAPAPEPSANPYSDSASMFARLSSLTARSAEPSAAPVDRAPERATVVPEMVVEEPELAVALDVPEPGAPASSAISVADAEAVRTESFDPFARIESTADRNLSDLVASPGVAAHAPVAMWSATPAAPPLAGAPSITPLPVDAWSSLPRPGPSFSPSTTQPPSRGPSVPAAFARRPRVVGPMPEDPFAVQAQMDAPPIEPAVPALASAQPAPIEPAGTAEGGTLPIAQEAAATRVPLANAMAEPAKGPSSIEVAGLSAGAPAADPGRAAADPPRFDPLAFLRSAAMENLTT